MADNFKIDKTLICLCCLKTCQQESQSPPTSTIGLGDKDKIGNSGDSAAGTAAVVVVISDSLKLLTEHLKIDTSKWTKKFPPVDEPEMGDENKGEEERNANGEISLTLCPDCVVEADKFGEVLKQYLAFQLKVELQKEKLYEIMKTGEEEGMKTYLDRILEANAGVENLRAEIMDKFSKQLPKDKEKKTAQQLTAEESDSSAATDDVVITDAAVSKIGGQNQLAKTNVEIVILDKSIKKNATSQENEKLYEVETRNSTETSSNEKQEQNDGNGKQQSPSTPNLSKIGSSSKQFDKITTNKTSATSTSSANRTKETIYKCKLCSKAFSKLSNWKMHTRTHEVTHDKVEVICVHCGKSFKDVNGLHNHSIEKHTLELLSENAPGISLEQLDNTVNAFINSGKRESFKDRFNYTCNHCPHSSFYTASGFRAHLLHRHFKNLVKQLQEGKPSKKSRRGPRRPQYSEVRTRFPAENGQSHKWLPYPENYQNWSNDVVMNDLFDTNQLQRTVVQNPIFIPSAATVNFVYHTNSEPFMFGH